MNRENSFVIFGHAIRYLGPVLLATSILSLGNLEVLGQFSLVMAIQAPVFIAASLGLRGQILAPTHPPSFERLALIRLLSLSAASLLAMALCLLIVPNVDMKISFGVLAFKIAESLLDLGTAWKQKIEQYRKSLFQSSLGIGFLSLGIAVSVVLALQGFIVLFAGLSLLAYSAFVTIKLIVTTEKSDGSAEISTKAIISKGLALGISFALVSLSATIPQVALVSTSGFASNGLYSLLTYFILFSEIIANPLAQIWLQNQSNPSANKSYKTNQMLWPQIFWRVSWVFIPSAILIPTGWQLLRLFEELPDLNWQTYLVVLCSMVAVHAFQLAGAYAQANQLHLHWLAGSAVTTALTFFAVYLIGDDLTVEWALTINLAVLIARTISLARAQRPPKPESIESPYVVILGSANGSMNLGDQAMFDGLVAALLKKRPDLRVLTDSFSSSWVSKYPHVTSMEPLSISMRLGGEKFTSRWRAVNFIGLLSNQIHVALTIRIRYIFASFGPVGSKQRNWYEALRNSEMVFISGAGAINSRYSVHGIYSWGMLTNWAKHLGKKVYLFGQGLGPFTISDAAFAKNWIRKVDYLGVRDIESLRLGKSFEVRNLELQTDWATFFKPSAIARKSGREAWEECGKPELALTLHQTSRTMNQRNYLRLLERVVEIAKKRKTKILLLPNMYGTNENHDGHFMNLLLEKLSPENRPWFVTVPRTLDYQETMHILGLVKFSITTRYHTAIFASMNGTRSLGLAVDNYWSIKLRAAQEMMGMSVFVRSISSPLPSDRILFELACSQEVSEFKSYEKQLSRSLNLAIDNV